MKFILLLSLFCTTAWASFETPLHKSMYLSPKLSKKTFNRIIGAFKRRFSPLAAPQGRKLEFFTDYEHDWAQAFARRWESDQVLVYGGIAGLPGTTEDSFALILCHELGHLYGGEPFSDAYNRMSVEGQADYWASEVCFKSIIDELSPRTPQSLSLRQCEDEIGCARHLDAALVVTAFFAATQSRAAPKLETPDLTSVEEVLMTHPHPQCRLDTYWSGWFEAAKPRCWMPSLLFIE